MNHAHSTYTLPAEPASGSQSDRFRFEGYDSISGEARHDQLAPEYSAIDPRAKTAHFMNLRPSTLSNLRPERLHRLGTLVLQHHPSAWDSQVSTPIKAFSDTPGLKELFLSRPFLAVAQKIEGLRWDRLERLVEIPDIANPSTNASPTLRLADFFQHCLIQCKKLKSLSICPGPYDSETARLGSGTWNALVVSFQKTPLPALRHLHLDIHYRPGNGEFPDLTFLKRFEFPLLEELKIDTYGELQCPDSSDLQRSLRSAVPNAVESLSLRIACSNDRASRGLAQMLDALPSVQKLVVNMPVHKEFFAGLVDKRRGGEVVVLRGLTSMTFNAWGGDEAEREYVRQAFQSYECHRYFKIWLAEVPEGGGEDGRKRVFVEEAPDHVLEALECFEREGRLLIVKQ